MHTFLYVSLIFGSAMSDYFKQSIVTILVQRIRCIEEYCNARYLMSKVFRALKDIYHNYFMI